MDGLHEAPALDYNGLEEETEINRIVIKNNMIGVIDTRLG